MINHFKKEARNHWNSVGLTPDSKILLLFDNCATHPDAMVLKSDSVEDYFLPPNTTSLIQPMDQIIIKSFKSHYKSEFLKKKKILNQDPSFTFSDCQKMFNIKDCLYLISESWNFVMQSTLVNSWHNVWPESPFIDTDCDEISGFNSMKAKTKELHL